MVLRGESDGHRPFRFTSARVVVTGGAQGIGREIVTAFAAEGARVAVLDRLVDEARLVAGETGGTAVQCDLEDAASTTTAMDTAIGELGGIDVLVNNAGVFRITPLLDISPDEWDWIFAVNVRAMLLTTQVAARAMIAQGDGGKIVNMASMGGKVGAPGQAHYAGIEGRRHLAHPGVGRGTGRPRDHRELDLPGIRPDRHGRRRPHARDDRRMDGEVTARAPGSTGGRGGHGPLPGVGRRRLLHRTGVERHRWDDHALTMTEASPTGLPQTDIFVDESLPTPALSFRGVSMTFSDGTHALDETTFDVHPGEFVTVVGPSGCGKSTLLRIASGLTMPTTGWVTIDRAGLGYVFQDATLLPWRNVMGNVELLAELEGLSKDETRRRAQENIELVGLAGHEKKYPRQMSGGMKMRASLARSLVLDPKVFLFDEPFGAVDEITRERLNDEVISLFMRKRFAGLFITHSISEAVFLSTRILVMSARPGGSSASSRFPSSTPACLTCGSSRSSAN